MLFFACSAETENQTDDRAYKQEDASGVSGESDKDLVKKFESINIVDSVALLGSWTVSRTRYLLKEITPENAGLEDMMDYLVGNGYTFKENKVYTVDATIDNDGIWSLVNNKTILHLFNNLRNDVEEYRVLVEGNKMYWLMEDENMQCVILLDRK
ncbi:MAG TPA: hypothetical protein VD905_09305 [Flavobacteriales bacterium]|nr:hypothetical protein [Flavobacteriales bacterium]